MKSYREKLLGYFRKCMSEGQHANFVLKTGSANTGIFQDIAVVETCEDWVIVQNTKKIFLIGIDSIAMVYIPKKAGKMAWKDILLNLKELK